MNQEFKFCVACGHNHWFVELRREWDCVRAKEQECKCSKLVPRSFKGKFA